MSGKRRTARELDSESDESEDYDIDVGETPKNQRALSRSSNNRRRVKETGHSDAAKGAAASIPLADSGEPYKVENDELVLEVDEKGEQKVDPNGTLKDDREYRVRTFTLKDRGDRRYMLSTEPARCMGYRDSYLLFQRHRKLWKVILSDEEKLELIERDLMPHSYKGRVIGIVTARSIFREFGAKIIVGGHRVTDDYYEQEAIKEGLTSADVADPDDQLPPTGEPYNKNRYVAWYGAHGAGSHQHVRESSEVPHKQEEGIELPNDEWLYESAVAVSNCNSRLTGERDKLLAPQGVYEPHVGLSFYAANTQPTTAHWRALGPRDDDDSKVEFTTVLHSSSRVIHTGLKDVDPSVYANVDPRVREAIAKQIALEMAQ